MCNKSSFFTFFFFLNDNFSWLRFFAFIRQGGNIWKRAIMLPPCRLYISERKIIREKMKLILRFFFYFEAENRWGVFNEKIYKIVTLFLVPQQGVRFDPDMPQTIRLEFAKSNTKVSKPKQPAAASATAHPTLVHPLTGRKYSPFSLYNNRLLILKTIFFTIARNTIYLLGNLSV